jgi:heterodisulfide reductase subunit B
VDELLANTLVARNLAIAEKTGLDFVAPCSGCYKNAYFTNEYLKQDPSLAEQIIDALEEDELHYSGSIAVRHLMEIYVQDIGLDEVKRKVTHPLNGLRVAPYYGCQIVRPRKDHEDVEDPHFFEDLMSAIGADPVAYPSRLRCCGGSLIITSRPAALALVYNLLQTAENAGATVIATACPLCQINLECYQQQVNQEYGTKLSIPILYFTQLIGLAMGIPPKQLKIGSELVPASDVLSYVKQQEAN